MAKKKAQQETIETPNELVEVSFQLPKELVQAEGVKAFVVGSFNNWDKTANPMRNCKNNFSAKIKLAKGEYQYKYYLSNDQWINDANDAKTSDGFGGENSIKIV